ncbi:MAG: crossover junction endodeoxyribonuclease RuvC [Caldilineaceae bacterium]|nr:crossover junction endodeoxyribonuclease RuvC [Caldilineaceae bacterium]
MTGYGVVAQGYHGELRFWLWCSRSQATMPQRLLEIHQDILALLNEFQPDQMAVEKLFFGRNVTTAITVGQARGVILLAAASKGIDVVEYTPAEIKQSIAGYGNADKRQMQEMVQRLLDLPEIPRPDDAADGVAIAVCHLQHARYAEMSMSY